MRSRKTAHHLPRPGYATGPRTPEGKARSAQNSFKHGLASGTLIVDGENHADYQALETSLVAEFSPVTPAEESLVRRLARASWLTDRATRLQNDCLAKPGKFDDRAFTHLMRYETKYSRDFHDALASLLLLEAA